MRTILNIRFQKSFQVPIMTTLMNIQQRQERWAKITSLKYRQLLLPIFHSWFHLERNKRKIIYELHSQTGRWRMIFYSLLNLPLLWSHMHMLVPWMALAIALKFLLKRVDCFDIKFFTSKLSNFAYTSHTHVHVSTHTRLIIKESSSLSSGYREEEGIQTSHRG